MPTVSGYSRLVAMRDYLTGWLEAKALKKADSKSVAAFVHEWITRFDLMGELVCDNGPENKGLTEELIKRYRIKNVRVAAYHPQSNGLIERGYQQIVDALAKMEGKWVVNLPFVVWAYRITTRASTGYAPYSLVFGQDCIPPIELTAMSWATVNWQEVTTTEELLAMRGRQLERREDDIQKAQNRVRQSRLASKQRFDRNRRQRKGEALQIGDMVLVHNTALQQQHSKKLDNRWMGPFIIRDKREDRGTYLLKELDGSELKTVYAGERIKKFYPREGVYQNPAKEEPEDEAEEEPEDEDT